MLYKKHLLEYRSTSETLPGNCREYGIVYQIQDVLSYTDLEANLKSNTNNTLMFEGRTSHLRDPPCFNLSLHYWRLTMCNYTGWINLGQVPSRFAIARRKVEHEVENTTCQTACGSSHFCRLKAYEFSSLFIVSGDEIAEWRSKMFLWLSTLGARNRNLACEKKRDEGERRVMSQLVAFLCAPQPIMCLKYIFMEKNILIKNVDSVC